MISNGASDVSIMFYRDAFGIAMEAVLHDLGEATDISDELIRAAAD